jgi:Leucine-rich repeat (LRR) protein
LYLQSNQLISLPESIGDLKNLTDLNIERNRIRILPRSIGKLKNLVSLSAGSNRLVAIPKEIGDLNLTGLWLDNNELKTIPHSIGYITTLTELCLQDNELTFLPSSLEKLSSLTVFYCHNNKLAALPSLVSMRKLTVRGLRVDGNPLEARGALPAFLTLHPDLHDLPVDASDNYGTPVDPFEEPPSGSTFIGEAEFRYLSNHCEDEFPENIKPQRYFHEGKIDQGLLVYE